MKLRIGTVVVLAFLAAPIVAAGQPPAKVHKIGFLPLSGACQPQDLGGSIHEVRRALATLGYAEGQNLIIECPLAAGQPERAPAEELVRLKVDLIIATGTSSALAAQRATRTIPIVVYFVADPVAVGLVASLARPGGNVTGLASQGAAQTMKSLELLKEGVPRVSRVAVLMDLSNQAQAALVADQDIAAQTLGLKLQRLDVRTPSDLDATLVAILREHAQALHLYPLRIARAEAERIMEFAVRHRLPTMGVAGTPYPRVLFSYSHSLREHYHRLASYVDRILRGAKPAELPVEQPTRFEFVVNLNTAKAIGLAIPASLLLRADRVLD